MQKKLLLLLLFLPVLSFSQNIGIGTTSPDPSAALDISAANKGVLVPKVALVNTTLASPVTNPAIGLLIYNTTVDTELSSGFYYWNGSLWEKIGTGTSGVPNGGIIEFAYKQTIPGFTYLGFAITNYFPLIGTGTGGWTDLPAFPITNYVENPSYTFYNNKFFTWSGQDNSYASYEQSGAYYNTLTNSWSLMNTTNAPAGRFGNVFVTDNLGGKMMIWGGVTSLTVAGSVPIVTNTGGTYDLVNNSWSAMANGPLAARTKHTAVWTGTKMLVWGGTNGTGTSYSDGAAYKPEADSWLALPAAPIAARYGQSAIWTGSKMIIWGGTNGTVIYNDGASYDPVANSWTPIASNMLGATFAHSATWTGTDMITFGGNNSYGTTATGYKYNPTSNSWSAISNPPGAYYTVTTVENHVAVWTGTEMIILGGHPHSSNTAVQVVRVYNPYTDTWHLYNSLPAGKIGAAAVWTGTELLIQAGSFYNNIGYKFNPTAGTPTDIEVSSGSVFYKYQKDY